MRSETGIDAGGHLVCLYFGFIQVPLHVLGPGRRVGLWLRGCSLRCHGCMSTDLWERTEESIRPVDDIFHEIQEAYNEYGAVGLTISGGEPLEQADGLRCLLQKCYDERLTNDILLYSGYPQKNLLHEHPWLAELVSALIAGPFEHDLPSEMPWCGSANQTLTIFQSGQRDKYKLWCNGTTRRMQLVKGSSFLRVIGIPRQNDIKQLRYLVNGVFNEESKNL